MKDEEEGLFFTGVTKIVFSNGAFRNRVRPTKQQQTDGGSRERNK